MLENIDEWVLFEGSDDEETNDSSFESNKHSGERVDENAHRFEIRTSTILPVWELIETKEGKIAIEQGEKIVETYADKHAEDIDPIWFLLVFLDCFPNRQGLLAKKVQVKRWLSYLIQVDGSLFQSNCFVCAVGDQIMRHGVNLAAHVQFKTSPILFKQANKASNEHITRATRM